MRWPMALVVGVVSLASVAPAQQEAARVSIAAHVVEPQKLPVQGDAAERLRVPDGFRITTFAKDLGNPRIIVAADDGSVYVTRRDQGDVLLLRDENGDGVADPPVVVARRPQAHGLAVTARTLYLVTVTDVYEADRQPDGRLGQLRRIIDDLPHAGQHPNRTIAVGPDGMLYISVGSTCNACDETSPEHATLLRAKPDGTSRLIHASGLRNTIGFDWQPSTGELYGMDHGIDWLGDEVQTEELNHIVHGKQYGWPYIYADGQVNPQDEPPGEIPATQWARMSQTPVLSYTAHAAPMQLIFNRSRQFPESYRNDAFVTMRGSWNRRRPSGYEVVRVRFEQGKPVAFEPFLTGFLVQQPGGRWGHLGRPVGLAQTRDGALLVGDDQNGVIYRIAHERGGGSAGPPTATQVRSPAVTAPSAQSERVAVERMGAAAKLRLTSPAFESRAALDVIYSDYGHKISPPLRWSGVPSAARSLVVLMEDPDADHPKPFVHWLLYNLPPTTEALPEALPSLPRLPALGGALQGRTSRGSVGYFGPRPPKADQAHRYHFQVFALDALLTLDPAASREQVLEAMQGRVLAAGELVTTFKAPTTDPK